ncbi:MAG: 30S ribosomal protein S24e [Candidatus Methanofastidiosia archaeon]
MEIEIFEERENPLLLRREMKFRVIHEKGSEKVSDLREKISALLNLDMDKFVIQNVMSSYGKSESVGFLKVYESRDRMFQIEARYVLRKNGFISEEKEGKQKEGG